MPIVGVPKRSNVKRRLNQKKSVHDHVKIQMDAGLAGANTIHSSKKYTSEQCHLNSI